MRLAFALGLLLAGPALAETAAFDGDWAVGDPAACTSPERGYSENVHLILREGELIGVENRCRLTDPEPVRGLPATLFDADCNGQGIPYAERILFMLDHEGRLVMLRDGFARHYPRCTGYARAPDN